MTEHLHGYPYSQDVITRLHGMAEVYRHFSQGKEVRTADLMDEAAGCIAALLADLNTYRLTMQRIAEDAPVQSSAEPTDAALQVISGTAPEASIPKKDQS